MTEEVLVYTGLEIFIHGLAAEAINHWRQHYDPAFAELAPHITLAYPPFVPLAQWPQVRPAVIACLAGIAPFQVTLRGLGMFPPVAPAEPNVLWLKPEDGGRLAHIRQVLEKQLPEYVPPRPIPYVPHVTIGFIQGDDFLRQAYAWVQAELHPIEFMVNEIIYEVADKQSGLKVMDAIPLTGASPVEGSSLFGRPRSRRKAQLKNEASRAKNAWTAQPVTERNGYDRS